eukprot:gb/GECH01011951.1/.p1 GENE.gb/GECH01011951.1/~~gb/GECH01011951.1/.p1  ORF type:complete len:398 (+),score=106.14 gb/GECH01011951.1/:1-1194(+)
MANSNNDNSISSNQNENDISLPEKMKGVIINEYGDPSVLKYQEDIIMPKIEKPDSVIVKLKASAINPVDWKIRSGNLSMVMKVKFPHILGFDGAGVIVKTGSQVSQYSVGDEVVVYKKALPPTNGTYAEYCVASVDSITKKPTNMTFEEATTLPLVGVTSWQSLVKSACLREGESVLVLGGSGGVGHIGVQMAKALGASHVSATCSTRNIDFVKEQGADRVIDYTQEDVVQVLGENSVDVVFDTVGGPDMLQTGNRVLRRTGRLVSIVGNQTEHNVTVGAALSIGWDIFSRKFASFFGSPSYYWVTALSNAEDLAAVFKMAENGSITPRIASVYDLSDIRSAHEQSQTHRTVGKIVLRIDPSEEDEAKRSVTKSNKNDNVGSSSSGGKDSGDNNPEE